MHETKQARNLLSNGYNFKFVKCSAREALNTKMDKLTNLVQRSDGGKKTNLNYLNQQLQNPYIYYKKGSHIIHENSWYAIKYKRGNCNYLNCSN